MNKYFLLFLGLSLSFLSCSDDDGIRNGDTPDPDPTADVTAQNFMWQAMNLWYFWQGDVNDLADDRFASNAEYTEFLEGYTDPESFFYDTLLYGEDRFSFANEDYSELVSSLSGISQSNGLEFGLGLIGDTNNVFGYVQYIWPDSDASTRDIQRGEFFTRVDGVQLTVDNYSNLLFGDNSTYTLGMATVTNNTISDNAKEVTLTKIENQIEDPILIAETLDVNGTKVAYLMYNRFLSSFNEELNAAFAQFVADGATELVLDMRYNPGGSVNTSRLLASMIYGTNTNDLYIRQRWNDKIQAQLSEDYLTDYFASSTGASAINTLNLNRVFVIATGSSASASELVMNGLAPYVDVIHIGETTRGKNEFSITLVDDSGNSFIYSDDREGQINANNSWGLQPLVGRNENADGFYDYTSGLVPTIELGEDLTNMGVLGDVNEPLLARALQEISGAGAKKDFTVQMKAEAFTSSRIQTPLKDNMYLDKPLGLNPEQ
ncbi:S41 family peptidase [Flagellimonas zhangzhouensis]|uniref:C-terminal processing protease CtpA/Prc, contains a PDZ domain n=1 Tax=Flagellimonas zhangzhouensis TaxID=1073328 RepID=A0A1H2RU93_9FLAO|nr:S41 family peptidase [Allomuricauda zhangzhouensis]SDQ67707.1 C-terminal processing protease CtpA/Prc, contains a PDZ domain [Allomuricauda zhangzhouensis]SDW22865.1 C-terminal processing protease CtpA/Prc, contains a PDZ domain [Allomuricauda zhangzhouensis]